MKETVDLDMVANSVMEDMFGVFVATTAARTISTIGPDVLSDREAAKIMICAQRQRDNFLDSVKTELVAISDADADEWLANAKAAQEKEEAMQEVVQEAMRKAMEGGEQ